MPGEPFADDLRVPLALLDAGRDGDRGDSSWGQVRGFPRRIKILRGRVGANAEPRELQGKRPIQRPFLAHPASDRSLHGKKAHSTNALAIARFLEQREEVERVRYVGLESHPQHALAVEQLVDGFGGMLSVHLHGGADQMNAFANATKLSGVAVSLGDLKTLVYPMPKRDNLIRVSVGCEDTADIIADFEQALAAVQTVAAPAYR